MEHVSHEHAEKFQNSSVCTVYEYITKHPGINIGVAEINGRYPDIGSAINHKCTEVGYILKGNGKLVTESETANFSGGDVILIPHGETYYWEGTFSVVISATPAWYPEQHEHISNSEKKDEVFFKRTAL